jgi:[FeFe] hydrogenase H-cluster maturation GTPase HydF
VLIIDTPGIDDEGSLGALRVKRARQILAKTDAAVLVADAVSGMTEADLELRRLFEERGLRAVIAYNKSDLLPAIPPAPETDGEIYLSAKTGFNITALKERIAVIAASDEPQTRLAGDLIKPLDFVTLVVPIDKAAPKGRLILPQQQVIRDVLDSGATALVVKESELRDTLAHLAKKPSLVITDSQAFASVAADTPPDIPLTSFSILFARYKGTLTGALRGVRSLDRLEDHDRLLIAEGCTHHRQCDDIGTVKLPRWLLGHTGKRLDFAFCSGVDFPEDLSAFKAVIHCGGCMLNGREMLKVF